MTRPKSRVKEKKIIFSSPKNNLTSDTLQNIPRKKHEKKIQDKFNKAISKFNQAKNSQAYSLFLKVSRMAKKFHYKPMIKESYQYLKKIEDELNARYSDEIEVHINEIKKIKNDTSISDLDEHFKKMIKITNLMYSSDIKETEIKRIKNFINDVKISKIKETILDLGTKYSRLHVKEIAEECKINDEKFIISVINDMISKKEINARFFESTFSVAFNQEANIQNFSTLKDMFITGSITQIKDKCIVCKGDIQHLFYQCPKCQANYHVKCANLLRNDEKNCFQCNEPIPHLPE